jgi:hypothetical protein
MAERSKGADMHIKPDAPSRAARLLAVALFFSLVLNGIALTGFYHDEAGLWDSAAAMHRCNLLVDDLMRVDAACHPNHPRAHGA